MKKFDAKKTTDDCYTPEAVYDVVKRWAMAHAAEPFTEAQIVRPFWPGGDYENEDYRVIRPPSGLSVRELFRIFALRLLLRVLHCSKG